MFHVELAPLGGIFGPLKSDLGVFWPFRATDFIMGKLKIWDNFLGPQLPILKFTFLESLRNLWLFGINKKDGCFFSGSDPFRTHVSWLPCPLRMRVNQSCTRGICLLLVFSHFQTFSMIFFHVFLFNPSKYQWEPWNWWSTGRCQGQLQKFWKTF